VTLTLVPGPAPAPVLADATIRSGPKATDVGLDRSLSSRRVSAIPPSAFACTPTKYLPGARPGGIVTLVVRVTPVPAVSAGTATIARLATAADTLELPDQVRTRRDLVGGAVFGASAMLRTVCVMVRLPPGSDALGVTATAETTRFGSAPPI